MTLEYDIYIYIYIKYKGPYLTVSVLCRHVGVKRGHPKKYSAVIDVCSLCASPTTAMGAVRYSIQDGNGTKRRHVVDKSIDASIVKSTSTLESSRRT